MRAFPLPLLCVDLTAVLCGVSAPPGMDMSGKQKKKMAMEEGRVIEGLVKGVECVCVCV